MSPPGKRSGPGGHPPPRTAANYEIAAAAKLHVDQSDGTAAAGPTAAIAAAIRYLASGDAQFDTLIVPRCPMCSFAHRHVAFEANASTFERSPGCRKSATYLVVVDQVVPAAPPLRRQVKGAA